MKFLKTLAIVCLLQLCFRPAVGLSQAPPQGGLVPALMTTDFNALVSEAPDRLVSMVNMVSPFNHRQICDCSSCDMQKCWEAGYYFGSVEYLMMWGKPRTTPALVTTSTPGTAAGDAGVLGLGSTETLFGGGTLGADSRQGGQLTLGRWMGANGDIGLGVRLFALESNTPQFSATSTGNPILARPFFNTVTSQEDAVITAHADVADGNIHAESRNDFMSGELFMRRHAWDGRGYEVEFLAGYHVTRMDDTLGVTTSSTFTDPSGAIAVGTTIDVNDLFEARNTFHGGSLGLSANFHRGDVHFKALGKISLGSMRQQMIIDGSNTVTPPVGGGAVTTAGGLLAQPTNIGQYERNEFVYVPEVMMTVAYDWRENIQLSAGYTFTYWSRVLLAGDQIDRNINTSQLGGGTLTGSASPAFTFRDTDFWLQGLRLGFNWVY
jgi:hypothetical protein